MQVTESAEDIMRRSREGAWIEIGVTFGNGSSLYVAPARERGLKYGSAGKAQRRACRSREGAWIEM